MLAEREVGIDPLLERIEAFLLEPRDLRLGERLIRELCERRPAPQRESLAQLRGGDLRLPRVERFLSFLDDVAEAVEVELVRLDA
ncbi:MAG TPA: hypothetical protein VIR59_09415 [Gaiellaceae bacterium]